MNSLKKMALYRSLDIIGIYVNCKVGGIRNDITRSVRLDIYGYNPLQ